MVIKEEKRKTDATPDSHLSYLEALQRSKGSKATNESHQMPETKVIQQK
jgi:hypothetical protein